MSDNKSSFTIKVQAMLDNVKSFINLRTALKNIESKLPKLKIQGTFDNINTKKKLNANLKSIRPKVTIDTDTSNATKKYGEE